MKKVKFSYLFIREFVAVLLAFVIGTATTKLIHFLMREMRWEVELVMFLASVVSWIIVLSMFATFVDKRIARKTMAQKTSEIMGETAVFYGEYGILKLDVPHKKIAYVANLNPYELQMLDAKEISRIESKTGMVFLGGTRYVYFEFYYKDKYKMRFPTFSSRQNYSMQSTYVLEAIAKADVFADMLRSMQKAGQ